MSALRTRQSGFGFLEAPRWRDGALWFVDYFSSQVLRGPLDGPAAPVAKVAGMPGGLGFLPDGAPLVVSQRDFKVLRIRPDGGLDTHADLSAHARGAANEMLVDAQGRAYVGHHGFDFFGGAEPQPSSLLLVSPEGAVRVVAEDLIFPNGMALSPDGSRLVVAESFANRLTLFDVDGAGGLSNRRVFAEVAPHTPDGVCMDREGAIWLGSPMTAAFVRVREGGEILQQIETADRRWAVACALAGEDLSVLVALTAATTLEGMPKGESQAFVETLDVSVPGAKQA